MSANSQTRIVIRHLSGSKVNQVEQISLNGLQEITIGRDPNSGIAYDQKRDDVVSRRHAVIRIEQGERLAFKIADLNSSNGTMLNGEPVGGDVELAPDDTIELGKGGPKFTFDVQPRPDYMAARTRVMGAIDASATRAMATATADMASATATKEFGAALASGTASTVPPKAAVGKETVLRMLFQERQKSGRVLRSAVAAVLAVVVVAGGAFYWHSRNMAIELREETAQAAAKAKADATASINAQLGQNARDIVKRYGDSTVVVVEQWRMYDAATGQPLFHKVVVDPKTGEKYPAFIQLPSGKIVRWLTLKDQDRQNIAISDGGQGSGFVVSEQGIILTNKHVAAGWMLPFSNIGIGLNKDNVGFLYPYGWEAGDAKDKRKPQAKPISLGNSDIVDLMGWIPEEGAYVFETGEPRAIGLDLNNPRALSGRNDVLEVRFPGNRMSMNAFNVRESTDADVAMIKVETGSALRPLELANDDHLTQGDDVIALGYPAISLKTKTTTTSNQGGMSLTREEVVPEPTVSSGVIQLIGSGFRKEGDVTVQGSMGDVFQMSINSAGHGNSGGPVFNTKGQVIGLFTYGKFRQGDAAATFAVPIKFGRALLNPQRATSN
ncbi:MAG TPA: trypsin-like peptidase domain-containing protein [Xanthobacteraceae bacterium]|nr:trypsin-like peptidase domain-containing protein [Xanthobacteraceae bacterium]